MAKRSLRQFYGNLPRHPQQYMNLDRRKIAAEYGFTIQQLFKAYWSWQEVFRFEGSSLTFEQYLNKLRVAGLTPSDVGNNEGQYNLSRYYDTGSYTDENCRFITRENSLKEQFGSLV